MYVLNCFLAILVGIFFITFGIAGAITSLMKRKGRSVLQVGAVLLGGASVIGYIITLENRLVAELGYLPSDDLIGPKLTAWFPVLMPIFGVVAWALALAKSIEDFKRT